MEYKNRYQQQQDYFKDYFRLKNIKEKELLRSSIGSKYIDSGKGTVYILSNTSLTGMVKVGMTNRPVEQRVKELNSSTSIPTPFKVEHVFEGVDAVRMESDLHQHLLGCRVSGRREFFACTVEDVVTCAKSL